MITEDGYRDSPIKTEALETLCNPSKTIGDLRKLIGFLGRYRPSICDFSRITKPLYDILCVSKENISPKWKCCSKKSQGQRSSNEKIEVTKDHSKIVDKFNIKYAKTMVYPDFLSPFTVNCDASEKELEAVLYQEQNGQMKVISYASRTLTPAEKNYNLHSGKLEFLALKGPLPKSLEAIFIMLKNLQSFLTAILSPT